MADLFRRGLDWLSRTLVSRAAQPVTYVRGSERVALRATVGRTEYDTMESDGLAVRTVAHDFHIRAAEFVLSGRAITPQRGDRIKWHLDGQTYLYEVMETPGGSVAELDPQRIHWRIHTKEAGTE